MAQRKYIPSDRREVMFNRFLDIITDTRTAHQTMIQIVAQEVRLTDAELEMVEGQLRELVALNTGALTVWLNDLGKEFVDSDDAEFVDSTGASLSSGGVPG